MPSTARQGSKGLAKPPYTWKTCKCLHASLLLFFIHFQPLRGVEGTRNIDLQRYFYQKGYATFTQGRVILLYWSPSSNRHWETVSPSRRNPLITGAGNLLQPAPLHLTFFGVCSQESPPSQPEQSGTVDSDGDDKWKLIGGIVAVVAAVTLGGVAISKVQKRALPNYIVSCLSCCQICADHS